MASISKEDLTCPLCSGIFFLPVILKCGHSFCKACLVKRWDCAESRVCPVCGLVVPSLGKPAINLELKLAVDAYHQAQRRSSSSEGVCHQHNKKLLIFCHNDEELICHICQLTKQHKVHECSPVEEAAQQKKTEILDCLNSLTKKLRIFLKTKTEWEETKAHIQSQGNEIEMAIKEEFEKLHHFLQEEQKERVKELRQEEEIKVEVLNKKLETIQDQITKLSTTIQDVERALKTTDVPFLSEYKETKIRVKCPFSQPQCVRDILINHADHLGSLRFKVWKKVTGHVYDAPVTLNPNTAHSNLKISKDLCSVHYSKQQTLPNNPERFSSQVCVLGAPGFTSGKHRWIVDVGQGKEWNIGVASESIKRKTTIFLSPSEGFWVIGRCHGEEFLWAQLTPRVKLTTKQMPERIVVELDYDKGKVLFSDAANLTLLHTFKDRFTEKVFPYLSPGLVQDGHKSIPLTIRPVLVKLERAQGASTGANKHKKSFLLKTD